MNKRDIEKYLGMVGSELHKKDLNLEITLLGGAAMLIEVENRDSTQDIVRSSCQILPPLQGHQQLWPLGKICLMVG